MAKKIPQVKITLTTDYLYTTEFLYELAAQIENYAPFENLHTCHGNATIEWPEEAYEE